MSLVTLSQESVRALVDAATDRVSDNTAVLCFAIAGAVGLGGLFTIIMSVLLALIFAALALCCGVSAHNSQAKGGGALAAGGYFPAASAAPSVTDNVAHIFAQAVRAQHGIPT